MRLGLGTTISKKAIKRKPRSLPANQSTKSLYFDGSDNMGDMPYDSGDEFLKSGDFTIAFWINLSTVGSYQMIFNNWSSFNNGFGIRVDSNNKLRCVHNSNGHISNTALSQDTWYHAAITCDKDGNSIWYINGSEDKTATSTSTNPAAENKWRFGVLAYGTGWKFNGYLDEFAIWSDILSADAIAEIYGSGKPPFKLTSGSGDYSSVSAGRMTHYFVMGDHASDDNTVMNNEGSIGNNMTLSNFASGDVSTEVP